MIEPEIPAKNAKALMNKTRITILKILSNRRYTPSELSKILGLTKPTILYHLSILESAGYVKKINSRKWTYYELTDLGLLILKLRRVRVILITVSIVTVVLLSLLSLIRVLRPKSSIKPIPKPLGGEIFLVDLVVVILILVLLLILMMYYLVVKAIDLRNITDGK